MLTVATVLRETLQATLQFAAWYLEQGADQVVIVFDDIDDPAIPLLTGHPNVSCIRATDEFLESVGMTRDRRFVRRQNKSVHKVYHGLSDGWLFNVDGDEFLYLEGRTLKQELAAMPDDVRGVTFLPAEHLSTPDAGGQAHFRVMMNRDQVKQIYGGRAPFFRRRKGLTGHTEGKTATRAGFSGAHVRQHYLHLDDGTVLADRVLGPPDGAYLLHFVDQGYEAWRARLPWRLSARGYCASLSNKLREVVESSDDDALDEIYRLMHVFDAERLKELQALGLSFTLDLQLDGLARKHFPDAYRGSQGPVSHVA